MNLSLGAIRSLPLAAALMSGDELVAATPEWRGATLGCVSFAARQARLLVDGDVASLGAAAVLETLLSALESAGVPGSDRVAVLAASLRVVAGRAGSARGSSKECVKLLLGAAGARTQARVDVGQVDDFAVDDPAVLALVALQVVVNAERHDGATTVRVDARRGVFTLRWPGDAVAAPASSRRRADRGRWGLGFARIAADSVGAVVGIPLAVGRGMVEVSIDVGVRRLTLPVGVVCAGRVQRSTATWDEETGLAPGAEVARRPRAAVLCTMAAATPGKIVDHQGWAARSVGDETWLAIPPDDVADRARDVLDGLVHERVLWEGVALVDRVRVVALAALTGASAGVGLPRVTAMSWNAAAPAVAAAAGYRGPLPEVTGLGAVDPHVVLYLAAELDGTLESRDDALLLRLPSRHAADVRLAGLSLESGTLRVG